MIPYDGRGRPRRPLFDRTCAVRKSVFMLLYKQSCTSLGVTIVRRRYRLAYVSSSLYNITIQTQTVTFRHDLTSSVGVCISFFPRNPEVHMPNAFRTPEVHGSRYQSPLAHRVVYIVVLR